MYLSNDNNYEVATSVASKSLTLKQAVVIAAICEFTGALFLGASVTSTVRGKIFNADLYEDEPEIVMLGMFTSLVTASFMMLVATYFGLPVSTTHTVIGCIIGFTISAKGFDSVNWSETKNIFISWVASPLLTGVVGFIIFAIIRFFILLSSNPFSRGYYTFSIILFVTIAIDVFFIFNKGTQNFTHFHENVYDDKWVVPTSMGIGALIGVLWLWPLGPYAKRRLQRQREVRQAESATQAIVNANMTSMHSIGGNKEAKGEHCAEYDPEEGSIKLTLSESVKSLKLSIEEKAISDNDSAGQIDNKSFKTKIHALGDQLGASIKEVVFDKSFTSQLQPQIQPKSQAQQPKKKKNFLVRFEEATYKQDLEQQAFQESKETQECWQGAATYDAEVEELYTYVQAFTAALSSFAHGANDVANSIAPLAAIIYIYRYGDLNSEAPVNKWILAYGGCGLVLGLLCYGYKVMKTIGYKLTALSPTRGSSAGLASSLVVATASYVGIPVSTTQCIVGAVAGVGLVEGRDNVQWTSLAKVCISWVVIFFVSCILSAGLFSAFAYSPSITTGT
eukprot:CCRYP_018958-RB/>CCRYP_018958-RB protein AED:0.07 eAED:0.07 QI:696/1/1/1/0.66/0.57/7/104/562